MFGQDYKNIYDINTSIQTSNDNEVKFKKDLSDIPKSIITLDQKKKNFSIK